MLYKISLFREIQFTAMDSDEHKMQSNRLNFVILMPEKQIAPIIGWGGKTIKQIRNETTDAKIHISSKSATSSERAVTISGDSVSVIRACELIYLELEKGTDNKIKPGPKRPKIELSLKLVIPSTACSGLIGRGGDTIQEIRKTTGCSVRLSSDSLPGSSDRLATVSGSSSAIVQCLERIGFILSEFPAISRKENKYHKHKIQKSKLEQISQGKLTNPLVSILALGEVISPKLMKNSSVLESIKITISEENIGAIFGKEGYKISDIRTKYWRTKED